MDVLHHSKGAVEYNLLIKKDEKIKKSKTRNKERRASK